MRHSPVVGVALSDTRRTPSGQQPAARRDPSPDRAHRARLARRPMRTTVTRDPAVIDVQQWARRYVALVRELATAEAMDRAG